MRSSTNGRWIIGIAVDGQLAAVAKIGPDTDNRLRTEAKVLSAFAPEQGDLGIAELLWSGEVDGNFILASRESAARPRVKTPLPEIGTLCTALVQGTSSRPPITHGDLAPWNVFCGPRGLCVIDWEHATWERRPLADLVHYAIQAGALLNRYSPAEVASALTAPGSAGMAPPRRL